MEANGSAAAVAAMINAGVASEAKRKHHDDQIEPFKDVKRVSRFILFYFLFFLFLLAVKSNFCQEGK